MGTNPTLGFLIQPLHFFGVLEVQAIQLGVGEFFIVRTVKFLPFLELFKFFGDIVQFTPGFGVINGATPERKIPQDRVFPFSTINSHA